MRSSAVVAVLALLGCSDEGAPANLATAAEACTRVTGCLGLTMGSCFSLVLVGRSLALDGDVLGKCVNEAQDCEAVGRCLNAGEKAGACNPSTDQARCDGTAIRRCVGGVWVGKDCAPLGLECIQDSVKQLWCGKSGSCGDSECHKDGVLSCVNKAMVFHSCGPGSCVDDANGTKACAGEGGSCQPNDVRCDGNTAVTCVNGKEHREPCAVCSDVDGAFCTKDNQCEGSSCDGAKLKACVEGVPFEEDCTKLGLGFSTCTEDATGAHCK